MSRKHIPTLLVSLALLAAPGLFTGTASAGSSALYTNTAPIVIPGTPQTSPFEIRPASPYPSQVSVQGLPGRITNVIVQLRQFAHTRPSDVDVLLVSPGGEASVVMSDACGGTAIPNATWTFDRSAPAAMGETACDGFLYRPTDHLVPQNELWPDAPAGPHTASFDRFIGDDPNGTWSLYVVDDAGGQSGQINLGWSLAIETEVPDAVVPGPAQAGRASPYPSTRIVSGVDGVIADLDVELRGVYHERPDDLELMLAGPRGQQVTLMSDVCEDSPVMGVDWVWTDEASSAMPPFGDPCGSDSYRPSDTAPGESLPDPAPAGPYGTSLSAFDATDPNGEWRLYAFDEQEGEANGFFVERFALQMQTRPKAKVGFATAAADVTEGQTRALTLTRSAAGGLGAGSVPVTSSPLSATSGSDFEPVSTTVEFAPGETQKTVSVGALGDSLEEEPETFALTIGQGTGDAEPATSPTAVVTIRGPANPDPDGPGGGGGGGPLGFGSKTLVTLELAARRIPARGPLKVRIANDNGFAVSGRLSGQTTKLRSATRKRMRVRGRTFQVGAHARSTVKLMLPKALRRLLKRKGRLSLRLVAKVKDPAGHSRSVTKTAKPKLKRKRTKGGLSR